MTQTQLVQRDFSYGIVRDIGPQSIDPRALGDHINGLYEEDGSPFKRGGSVDFSTKILGTATGRLNLCTNPKAAVDATLWTNTGLTTFARVTDAPGDVPDAISSGETAFHAVGDTDLDRARHDFAVTNTLVYRFSVYVYLNSSSATGIRVRVRDAADAVVATGTTHSTLGTWTRLDVSVTATATATWRATIEQVGAGATDFYFAGVLIEQSASLGSYFDGDFETADWTGTDDLSTSREIVAADTVWGWDGYFEPGRRTIAATTADFFVLDAAEKPVNIGGPGLAGPVQAAMLEGKLFIGGGYIYAGSRKAASYSTGTVTLTQGSKAVTGSGTSWLANLDAGMLFQRGNERTYVIASVDSDTTLTLRDAYAGASGGGISYTAHNIYTITAADPYEAGPFYVEVANKLLTSSSKTLKFTEELAPHDWDFTTIGGQNVPNEHKFQGVITGAGSIAQTVLVGTTQGLLLLDGIAYDIVDSQGNNNHRIKILTRELVSYGPMFTWNQALLVPCLSGVFLIDGASEPARVSHPIDSLWRAYAAAGYRPGQGAVYANHYIQPMLSGATVVDTLIARLDRPIEIAGQVGYPWSRAGGEGINNPSYFVRTFETAADSKLLAANKPLARILECSGFFDPSSTNMLDADGVAPEWVLVTRDYETGGLTANMVRRLRSRHELVGDGAEIAVEYGFGISAISTDNWDENDWADESATLDPDDLYWEDDDDDVYVALACALTESDGLTPQSCRVNTKARFIRYRFRNSDPCERLRLRSLEQFIRPSMAGRR